MHEYKRILRLNVTIISFLEMFFYLEIILEEKMYDNEY